MPHDANGTLLKVGDPVTLFGKVTEITGESETDCNIVIQTIDKHNLGYKPIIACNSKLATKFKVEAS